MRSPAAACLGVFLLAAVNARASDTAEAIEKTPVGVLKLQGVDLADAVARLRDQTQKPIFINWRVLEAAGIPRKLPVTIDLSGLTLGEAVDRLLKEVGGRQVVLGSVAVEGVVTISTADDLACDVETRTYDIRTALGPNDAGRPQRRERMLRRVRGIDPLSWKDNGGRLGSVRELGGQLIVTQTPAVHARIAVELLDGLPAAERARRMLDSKRAATPQAAVVPDPRP